MAYTPPNTFADGTTLVAAELEGNLQALRAYLHRSVLSGDIETSKWIDTRHVQPPDYDAFTGLQHGVTGYQGGQWAGGTQIRLQFATKYLSGNGRPESETFHAIPQSAVSLALRQPAFCLFHYWFELENGRDSSTAAYQLPVAERRVFVVPYTGVGPFESGDAYAHRARVQETRNVNESLGSSYPIGLDRPFVLAGGYGAKQGTFALSRDSPGTITFGLAAQSLTDRCGIVNWGFAAEVFYF